MCGISGFYSINAFDFNNAILKMSSALSHRGPDSSRTWKDKIQELFLVIRDYQF